MKRVPSWLPILSVLAGATLGASSGLYIKGVGFSSLAMTGFRMGIPMLLTLPSMLRGGRALGEPGRRKGLWIASAINAVRMLLFVMAYKMTSVGNAVVLLYLWPIFALVFDGLRTKRAPGPVRVSLVAMSFAGVVVMNLHRGFGLSGDDFYGSLLMIVASAGFAVTVIMFKDALASVRETDAVFFQNAVGAVVYLPFLIAELGSAPLIDIAIGAGYGASVGMAGFFFFFFAMKRLPIFQYGALAYSEVPIGVLLGVLVLGESFAPNQLAGAVIVVVASFLAQRMRSASR
jgi:drug/metabolite transporter (DMT)-like permease